jgi:gluconolactonase
MADVDVVATSLRFPEGPVVFGGQVIVTEIAAGTLTAIDPATGERTTVADGLPGPNGAALAPDGSLLVTDNGGYFDWFEHGGLTIPTAGAAAHRPGAVLRVDPGTGAVGVACDRLDGAPLVAPNDLVMDADGGAWFTDFGVQRDTVAAGRPGVGYLPADGSAGRGVVWGTHQANGIGLSADGDELYVAETHDGRLWAFAVTSPGTVTAGGASASTTAGATHGGRLLHEANGFMFDSLAVDPDGWVCVATIGPGGGVTCVHPVSGEVRRVTAPDDLTTNICFAHGDGDIVEAWLTLSSTGVLVRIADWRAARDAT